MSKSKLSPCPDCGGECYANEKLAEVRCRRCEYCRDGETIEQIITNHERLAGVCEWREEEDCWETECGSTWMESFSHRINFCPQCGRKVEVKE